MNKKAIPLLESLEMFKFLNFSQIIPVLFVILTLRAVTARQSIPESFTFSNTYFKTYY